ncbi:Unknown protein, partial [Striga hermonthica]
LIGFVRLDKGCCMLSQADRIYPIRRACLPCQADRIGPISQGLLHSRQADQGRLVRRRSLT